MMRVLLIALGLVVLALAQTAPFPGGVSPKRGNNCVRWVNPPGLSLPTGPFSQGATVQPGCWSLDLAGNRGLFPNGTQPSLGEGLTNATEVREAKKNMVRQTFQNMLTNAAFHGASKWDCSNLIVICYNLVDCRPIVNEVEIEIWGPSNATAPNHPPRTIVGDSSLNGLFCVSNEDPTAWVRGTAGPGGQVLCPAGYFGAGDFVEIKGRFWSSDRPDSLNYFNACSNNGLGRNLFCL